MVVCDAQAEIDRLWEALEARAAPIEQCGWVTGPLGPLLADRAASVLGEHDASDPRTAPRSKRAAEAMLKMVKLDIAGLEAAARG